MAAPLNSFLRCQYRIANRGYSKFSEQKMSYVCSLWSISLRSGSVFTAFRKVETAHITHTPTFTLTPVSAFILSPVRKLSHNTKRLCWKCGSEVNTEKELFFCKCGVVQDVKDLTYFELLGLPMLYDIDTQKLSQLFKDLQKQLHPDKYSLKSEREQQIAEEQSSCVNKAYFTLLKPLTRALYLLELHGHAVEEDNTSVDQNFLMEIMEVNEEIMDADSQDALQVIEATNNASINQCVKGISQAFKDNDIEKAKEITIRLKYFVNIQGKINDIYQKNFGV